MNRKILFIKICYFIGAGVDFLAVFPLLFPKVSRIMFGLPNFNAHNDFLYASRIGASLMMGWTILLLWGSQKPIERRGILLLTVCPVLVGLISSSILAVTSGFIKPMFMLPLWVFYIVITPAYIVAYLLAGRMSPDQKRESAVIA